MIGRTVAWVIGRCGDEISLVDGEETLSIRGVVQPVQSKTVEQRLPTALGQMDEGRYLYLGLPDYPIDSRRHRIIWRGRPFGVENAHPIYVGDEISHWWGVLVAEDERK